jgi:hypothetical protein
MIDAETLYRQLGELLISVPDFYKPGPLSPDGHQWLARAYALVKTGDDFEDMNRMKWLTQNLDQLMEPPGFGRDAEGHAPYRGRRGGSVTDRGARQLYSCG